MKKRRKKFKKTITLEDLIVEMMPFSEELKNWCKLHPEFLVALKVINPERFVALGGIITSSSPNYPDDEIIGILVYDNIRGIFKQDFIINKGRANREFFLYTRNPGRLSSTYVKDINEFYSKYGKGDYYINTHHLSFDNLPEEIRSRAIDSLRLADKLKKAGYKKPTQEQIDNAYNQLLKIKKSTWFLKTKLNRYNYRNLENGMFDLLLNRVSVVKPV